MFNRVDPFQQLIGYSCRTDLKEGIHTWKLGTTISDHVTDLAKHVTSYIADKKNSSHGRFPHTLLSSKALMWLAALGILLMTVYTNVNNQRSPWDDCAPSGNVKVFLGQRH